MEKQVFSRYSEWKLLLEKAEKDWDAAHQRPKVVNFVTGILGYNLFIIDERIVEPINQYDADGTVNIKVEELMFLIRGVREKIDSKPAM